MSSQVSTTKTSRSMLIVARHSPYGSGLARASLDLTLAAAAFEQEVALLFLGDGVLQLVPEQDGHLLGAKTIARQLASLPMYDIKSVYADQGAAQRLGVNLANSPVAVKPLSAGEASRLMADFDHVMSF